MDRSAVMNAATDAGIYPPVSTGFFPHDLAEIARDNPRMSQVIDFYQRLDQRRDEKGFTDRSLSMAVTGKPDLIRDGKKRQRLPSGNNLVKVAEVLEVSVDWLTGKDALAIPSDVRIADPNIPFQAFPSGRRNETLPVLGTAHGGTVIYQDTAGDDADVEQTLFEPTQVVRYVTRPPALNGADEAYAVYVEGESMDPRYRPGDMAVVDPRKPPQIGDDVIVQLSENGHDEICAILIKTLARRSPDFIELLQYNPPLRFRVDSRRVRRMHRIMSQGDLLGG